MISSVLRLPGVKINPGGSTPFADVVAVPEPASLALLGFGAAAAAWAARRRR